MQLVEYCIMQLAAVGRVMYYAACCSG